MRIAGYFTKYLARIFLALALLSQSAIAQQATILGNGGGSGSVTSVATGACLTGGPITTTGTVSGTYVINAQTGTTYTVLSTDACKLVSFSNASTIAVTLPQATGSFAAGFGFDVISLGAGIVTITPTTSTINGAATLTLAKGQSCSIVSDGTNWQVSACNAIPIVWNQQQSSAVTPLTVSTTTFTPTGATNNYSFTLVTACASACTIANPSTTPVPGTSGVFAITQFSTAKTLTWGSQYYAAGGSSTIQPDSTVNSLNYVSYYVADATHIILSIGAANATH